MTMCEWFRGIGLALTLLVGMSASVMAQAEPVEVWECKDFIDEGSVLVTATVDSSRETGMITVAGVTHHTKFSVEGFNRRWDFGPKDHPTRYAFIIKPDGTGLYYDFSTGDQQMRASEVMKCRQRKGKREQ